MFRVVLCALALPSSSAPLLAAMPPSVVIKTVASTPQNVEAGRESNAYRGEAVFFNQLARVVAVGSPGCYHLSASEDEARWVYVLEDLCSSRDLRYIPQSQGAGEREVREED